MSDLINKVILAYSGGLDTSVIIPWLIENYNCEVIAFAADLGQKEELDGLKEKAIKSGASKIYIEDLREEFVKDYIFPALRAGAVYEDHYLLGTSFARPLIAKKQIEIAEKEKASAVAHGATGKGNDQVRFELTYMALNPRIRIIAPWKDDKWKIESREDAVEYAKKKNIPLSTAPKKNPYSEDRNAWHISHEGYDLEDPWNEPQEDLLSISRPIKDAPDTPEYLEIEFKGGDPISVNQKKQSPYTLLDELNTIGGKHAVGQEDLVENRLVGMKSRGIYETPGGSILYRAHRALETLVLDKDTYHYKQQLALRYADLVYNGQWFTPLREALDAFVDSTQKYVTGTVRIKLYKGNIIVAGIKSQYSLYHHDLATFAKDEIYDQKDANGFIKLYGLPLKVRALSQESNRKQPL
ncbi:argininosuccinate synthase [Candidatus Margulisiibacteriota bacterium]